MRHDNGHGRPARFSHHGGNVNLPHKIGPAERAARETWGEPVTEHGAHWNLRRGRHWLLQQPSRREVLLLCVVAAGVVVLALGHWMGW